MSGAIGISEQAVPAPSSPNNVNSTTTDNVVSGVRISAAMNLYRHIQYTKTIGEGSYGVVHPLKENNTCVVKLLNYKDPETFDPEIISSTLREIVFSSSLSHPHIVNVRSVALDTQRPCIVMDHAGMSLAKFIDQMTLTNRASSTTTCINNNNDDAASTPVLQSNNQNISASATQHTTVANNSNGRRQPIAMHIVRTIMRQLLEAVAYCHTHNVVHRDIKPSNIMIQCEMPASVESMQGPSAGTPASSSLATEPRSLGDSSSAPCLHVRLIDFGIACATTQSSTATWTWSGDTNKNNSMQHQQHRYKQQDSGLRTNCPVLQNDYNDSKCHTSGMVTLGFRAPELLMNKDKRDYIPQALDIWSVGIVMLALMTSRSLPISYADRKSSLVSIHHLVPAPPEYASFVEQVLARRIDTTGCSSQSAPTPLRQRIMTHYASYFSVESLSKLGGAINTPNHGEEQYSSHDELQLLRRGIDLMEKILNWSPTQRPTAMQCLQHDFFTTRRCDSVTPLHSGPQWTHWYQTGTVARIPPNWNTTAQLWLMDADPNEQVNTNTLNLSFIQNPLYCMDAQYRLHQYAATMYSHRSVDRVMQRQIDRLAMRLLLCYESSTVALKQHYMSQFNTFYVPLCCWTLSDRFCRLDSVSMDYVAELILGNMDMNSYLANLEFYVLSVVLLTTTTATSTIMPS